MPEDHAYPALAADAVEGTAFGVPLKVCSLEHLRAMKRAADRLRDCTDLEGLQTARPGG